MEEISLPCRQFELCTFLSYSGSILFFAWSVIDVCSECLIMVRLTVVPSAVAADKGSASEMHLCQLLLKPIANDISDFN